MGYWDNETQEESFEKSMEDLANHVDTTVGLLRDPSDHLQKMVSEFLALRSYSRNCTNAWVAYYAAIRKVCDGWITQNNGMMFIRNAGDLLDDAIRQWEESSRRVEVLHDEWRRLCTFANFSSVILTNNNDPGDHYKVKKDVGDFTSQVEGTPLHDLKN